jgi:hypothetical protein
MWGERQEGEAAVCSHVLVSKSSYVLTKEHMADFRMLNSFMLTLGLESCSARSTTRDLGHGAEPLGSLDWA